MGWSLLMNSVVQSDSRINVISEELFWHLGAFDQKERIKLLKILKTLMSIMSQEIYRLQCLYVFLVIGLSRAQSACKNAANTTLTRNLHNYH